MAGIAGIARPAKTVEVQRMLNKIAHRGRAVREVFEAEGVTMGAVAPAPQTTAISRPHTAVRDYAGYGHYAQAQILHDRLALIRDPLGVAPLYYGQTTDGALCFASEVKALIGVARNITELPPGSFYDGQRVDPHFRLEPRPPLKETPEQIAIELGVRLGDAVQKCVHPDLFGAWLSGGLDSSALVALARPRTKALHTFAGGVAGAPDLQYARTVAEFVGTEHHETVVSLEDMLRVLPDVIYHLESFDALLVRSSIVNFMVAKQASEYVPAVLSGEGGDELFAGYEYLKSLAREQLSAELLDITSRLHNTALQRVDRCASAHGLVAHICFLDPAVVDLALRIPVEFKLRGTVEKWILRQPLRGLLPESVLERTKSKFWQGAGVGELLAEHAEKNVSDNDFQHERQLLNGWTLNTKEELLYYRLFGEHFGEVEDLTWMGRTKSAPRS
jgi:asparagine synthase (glutamine-hydrolysing)